MAGLRLPVRSILPHCPQQLRLLSSLTLMELPARARAAARVAAKAAAREAKAKDAVEAKVATAKSPAVLAKRPCLRTAGLHS